MASPGSGVSDVGHVCRLRHDGVVRVDEDRPVLFLLGPDAICIADSYQIPMKTLHVVDAATLPKLQMFTNCQCRIETALRANSLQGAASANCGARAGRLHGRRQLPDKLQRYHPYR